MKVDPDLGEDRRPTIEGETADPFRESMEALTALGNYLGAARHIAADPAKGTRQILAEILEKAREQHERSASALRRLRASQTPGNIRRT
jgi:hypothetical protein